MASNVLTALLPVVAAVSGQGSQGDGDTCVKFARSRDANSVDGIQRKQSERPEEKHGSGRGVQQVHHFEGCPAQWEQGTQSIHSCCVHMSLLTFASWVQVRDHSKMHLGASPFSNACGKVARTSHCLSFIPLRPVTFVLNRISTGDVVCSTVLENV